MHAQLLSRVQVFGPRELQPARFLCPWEFQARILEWVVISSSRGSSQLMDQAASPELQADSLPLSHQLSLLHILSTPPNQHIQNRTPDHSSNFHSSWCLPHLGHVPGNFVLTVAQAQNLVSGLDLSLSTPFPLSLSTFIFLYLSHYYVKIQSYLYL